MKLTGRDGALRIYDSSEIVRSGLKVWDYDVTGPSWNDITSDVEADDASHAAFCVDAGDYLYIGDTLPFARIRVKFGEGNAASADTGALIAEYYDGDSWETFTVIDGTASGGNCLQQDGYVDYQIPRDWAANAVNGTTKYWVRWHPTSDPATAPDADILAAVDGQYYEIPFAGMDFAGPIGRPRPEEILVLDRDRVDSNAHYIEGPDDPMFDPLEIAWSCLIDSTHRKRPADALQCANPNDGANWTSTGTSTKGDTKNDGTNANPAFSDASKKTVNVQILFTSPRSGGYDWGIAYYEVYFPQNEQSQAESPDGIKLSCKGGCYGVIEEINAFANRY